MGFAAFNYLIGIDTGKNTGVCIYNPSTKKILKIYTCLIHTALSEVLHWKELGEIFVMVEDARKRKWFGENSDAKKQGAGSVKRDATIWEDFLTDYEIPFEMIAPKPHKTKWTDELFRKVTKWEGQTSNHGRDAAILVYGL